jgi:hypothetical protein
LAIFAPDCSQNEKTGFRQQKPIFAPNGGNTVSSMEPGLASFN